MLSSARGNPFVTVVEITSPRFRWIWEYTGEPPVTELETPGFDSFQIVAAHVYTVSYASRDGD